jgi:hypothetical protein
VARKAPDPEAEFDRLKAAYLDIRTRTLRTFVKNYNPTDDMRRELQETAFHIAEYFCAPSD